jgi:hypothetical protein
MKIYRHGDSLRQKRKEEIDLGFDTKDSRLLANENLHRTPIQVFARRKVEYLNQLTDKQFCSKCRTELVLLQKQQLLLCRNCSMTFPLLSNTALLEPDGQSLKPYGSQVDDPNNEDRPWFIGLVDSEEDKELDWEVTQSTGDGRIQHVRLRRGLPPSAYRIRPTDVDNPS